MKRTNGLLIAMTVFLAFVLAQPLIAQDEVRTNEATVLQYLDSFYHHQDLQAASALLADNVLFHDPIRTTENLNQFVQNYWSTFDLVARITVTPYTLIEQDDRVVVPYLWEGKYQLEEASVEYMDYPVSGNGVMFFRLVDGQIAEIWNQSEWHNFSILGSTEDYRSAVNLVAMVQPASIPTAEILRPAVDEPATSSVAIAEILRPAMATAPGMSQHAILNWIHSYNQGQLDVNLMAPEFKEHSCPCDGVGTLDLKAYTDRFNQLKANHQLVTLTPFGHEEAFTMVSEGDLTVLLYDTIGNRYGSAPQGISIFHMENGLITDLWTF